MNIVKVNGSPRIRGNTKRILNLCENSMEEILSNSSNKYETIDIYEWDLEWCKGCRVCLDLSELQCPRKDRLAVIKENLQQADGMIIGSPVYVEDVSGGMKNFLDRMSFNCHRPFLNGKPVYIYTSSASRSSKHALKTMKRAIISWGGNIVATDKFSMGKLMKQQEVEEKFSEIIRKRMQSMTKQIERNKVTLYGLIAFGIQKRYWGKKKGTADYDYWNSMGWLMPDCIYYNDVKISIIKKYTAIFISSTMEMCMR
ncbi:flavodoxin family protein [Anaerosporobacter sp.]